MTLTNWLADKNKPGFHRGNGDLTTRSCSIFVSIVCALGWTFIRDISDNQFITYTFITYTCCTTNNVNPRIGLRGGLSGKPLLFYVMSNYFRNLCFLVKHFLIFTSTTGKQKVFFFNCLFKYPQRKTTFKTAFVSLLISFFLCFNLNWERFTRDWRKIKNKERSVQHPGGTFDLSFREEDKNTATLNNTFPSPEKFQF